MLTGLKPFQARIGYLTRELLLTLRSDMDQRSSLSVVFQIYSDF